MGMDALNNLKKAGLLTMLVAVGMLIGFPQKTQSPQIRTSDCIEISTIDNKNSVYETSQALSITLVREIKSVLLKENDITKSDNILANAKIIYLANFDLGQQLDNYPDLIRQCPQDLSCELTDLSDNINILKNRLNAVKRYGLRLSNILNNTYGNNSLSSQIRKYHRQQSNRLKELPDYYSDCISISKE